MPVPIAKISTPARVWLDVELLGNFADTNLVGSVCSLFRGEEVVVENNNPRQSVFFVERILTENAKFSRRDRQVRLNCL